MASNKFATMLHRNTNKITLILVYALLEWILIVLLLLNSLFSYLIIKFAKFFGLKPPCLWCTRLDHVLDPANGNKNMHTDLLCEVHAKEISKLGYCSNHRNLAESSGMCEDCSSSRPEFQGFSKNFGLFQWIRGFGVIGNQKEKVGVNGEASLNCSCCGVNLENTMYSSCILLKTSSWNVLECAQKENLINESGEFDDNPIQKVCDSDQKILNFASDLCDDEKVLEDKHPSDQILSGLDENSEINSVPLFVNEMKHLDGGEDEKSELNVETMEETANLSLKNDYVEACVEEDAAPLEIPPQHLELFLDYSGHRLVPIELVDSTTEETQSKDNVKTEDHNRYKDACEVQVGGKEDLVLKSRSRSSDEVSTFIDVDINVEPKYAMLDSMEMEEDENSLVFHAKERQFPSEDVSEVQQMAGAAGETHLDIYTACEELVRMANQKHEGDVSIGTDIPGLDITGEIQNQEFIRAHEEPSTSFANLYEADDHGPVQVEEQIVALQCLTVQDMMNNQPDQLEPNESEESVDGSVTSEVEESDGDVTIECLKSALRAERKTLRALYTELEEERNASAVAATQTMAMINRLQEEKAAMQMEALQYQRMMEEQSEYDQETLQLLNELMVKREKEKQEVEKELEVCRKNLLEYELKDKIRALKKNNGLFSGNSCSNAEDSDGFSIDITQEAKEGEGSCGNEEYGNQNTPVDVVVDLEESLSDFEEERLSILSQLKILEETLMTLEEEDNEKLVEDEKNGIFNGEANGHANGFVKEMNGKHGHQQRRIAGLKRKSLLPIFDAISDENDVTMNGNGNYGFDSNGVDKSYLLKLEAGNCKKLAIDEEVDHLYERLQALEADREFLKHCVSSLKKGDEGMNLLKEILQHLRHLRNAELSFRNLSDTAVI